jgi:probable rRNA maturation factor
MGNFSEIEYRGIDEKKEYEELIEKVLKKCFEIENIEDKNFYMSIILTTPAEIRKLNKEYRNIDRETDVLSFPMYEKEELETVKKQKQEWKDTLGDIVISIERVEEQAKEYGHSFEREFAYMLVHGFYHIMGEDHIEEEDKKIMRAKEENVLSKLNIVRE